MSNRFLLLLTLVLFCQNSLAEKNSSIDFEIAPSRNYGFTLGDEISATVLINTSYGYQLEEATMPKPGPINDWLSLTGIKLEEDQEDYDYQLHLYYQVFKSVKQSIQLTIPEFPLTFDNRLKNISIIIPAWDITYNPLVPASISDNQVTIQAARKPTQLINSNLIPVISWLLLFAFLIALYLAWIYDKLPFLNRYSGPFARSCHNLIELNNKPETESKTREALSCFHQAINECAGRTVFTENLAHFFQQHPEFSEAKQQTEKLFKFSQHLFFSQSRRRVSGLTTEQILTLCYLYRKIERGTRWS